MVEIEVRMSNEQLLRCMADFCAVSQQLMLSGLSQAEVLFVLLYTGGAAMKQAGLQVRLDLPVNVMLPALALGYQSARKAEESPIVGANGIPLLG